METSKILANTKILWEQLSQSQEMGLDTYGDNIPTLQQALLSTSTSIRTLRNWISNHNFADWKSEILFFKHWKPLFFSKYLFLSSKIKFLSNQLTQNKDKKKRISQLLKDIDFFTDQHKDFIAYIHLNESYKDRQFFTRGHYNIFSLSYIHLYTIDDNFTTWGDIILSQHLANYDMYNFLHNLLKSNQKSTSTNTSSLTWSASKVALTELICALYHSHCINGGNIELAAVIRHFENLFNISLGNYHKTIGEIKYRKSDTTKFLTLLQDNLNGYIENSDEY